MVLTWHIISCTFKPTMKISGSGYYVRFWREILILVVPSFALIAHQYLADGRKIIKMQLAVFILGIVFANPLASGRGRCPIALISDLVPCRSKAWKLMIEINELTTVLIISLLIIFVHHPLAAWWKSFSYIFPSIHYFLQNYQLQAEKDTVISLGRKIKISKNL